MAFTCTISTIELELGFHDHSVAVLESLELSKWISQASTEVQASKP